MSVGGKDKKIFFFFFFWGSENVAYLRVGKGFDCIIQQIGCEFGGVVEG
jgi:hypothetical protein